MHIQGYETTERKVNLKVQPQDALKALKIEVFGKLGITRIDALYDPINKQIVVYEDEQYGSHSSVERKVLIEEPTPDQLVAIQTFQNIQDLLYSYK